MQPIITLHATHEWRLIEMDFAIQLTRTCARCGHTLREHIKNTNLTDDDKDTMMGYFIFVGCGLIVVNQKNMKRDQCFCTDFITSWVNRMP